MTDNEILVPTYPGGPLVTPAERAAIKAAADQHIAAVASTTRSLHAAANGIGGIRGDRAADPGYNPRFHERTDAVVRHLQTSHDLTYIDHHKGTFWHLQLHHERENNPAPRRYDEHDPELQAAVFVHYVHKANTVHVFRDVPTEYGWLTLTCWPEGRCIVNEAAECLGAYGANYGTCYLLLQRGQFILAFECCNACYQHLCDVVEGGEILAESNAAAAAGLIRLGGNGNA